jgi:hypothetical protein
MHGGRYRRGRRPDQGRLIPWGVSLVSRSNNRQMPHAKVAPHNQDFRQWG